MNAGADAPRRARALVALVSALCLGTGVLIGLALRADGPRPATYLEQLTRELALRPEQVAAIEAALAAEDRDIDALLKRQLEELEEPVAARRARTEELLLAALDDSQRQLYARLTRAGGAAGEDGQVPAADAGGAGGRR